MHRYEDCSVNDGIHAEQRVVDKRPPGACWRCWGAGYLRGDLYNHGKKEWTHHHAIQCPSCGS